MRKFSADFVFPVSEAPVKNGIVITDDSGVIMQLINQDEIDYEINDVEFHKGIICPGFINTHCHLELSFLKNKIEEKTGLDNFVRIIENKRYEKAEIIEEAIIEAEMEMFRNGIVAIGDISNDDYTFKYKNESKIYYHTFIEVFRFDAAKAERAFERGKFLAEQLKRFDKKLKYSITPHAPYSCSKELFLKLIDNAKINSDFLTIHNQENEEENTFFKTKTGKLVERLNSFGVNIDNWQPPRKKSLPYVMDIIDDDVKLLLVHNTVTNKDDIAYALNKNNNLWWCLCPGANLYIENKLPDVNLFYSKVKERITIGTDSLASNSCLSVLEELKILQQKFGYVELNELMKWGTLQGAQFLEIDEKYGSFEKGKKPGVNLIYNLDLKEFKLLKKTAVNKLI